MTGRYRIHKHGTENDSWYSVSYESFRDHKQNYSVRCGSKEQAFVLFNQLVYEEQSSFDSVICESF
jgi:hypothetical protein